LDKNRSETKKQALV